MQLLLHYHSLLGLVVTRIGTELFAEDRDIGLTIYPTPLDILELVQYAAHVG
jgi:hypothetical protein